MTISPEAEPGSEQLAQSEDQSATAQRKSPPFVGGDISDQFYRQISQVLKKQQSFDLAGYKDLCIKRRVAARIRAVGLAEPEQYLDFLQQSADEQEQLLEALTIHVSQFFRNPSTFAVLEKQVLPQLFQQSRSQHSKLRIWSAGCAGGEEPYSLALLCQQQLKPGDQLSIVATDISPEVLQRAKQAKFTAQRVREVPSELLSEHFVGRDNQYQLSREIQRLVRFYRHDILTEQQFFRVDLVLCRNLLIYFSRPQQAQVVRLLAKALAPGGYLVLGRAETLVAPCRDLFVCIDPAERIYQRLASE